jgi:hypothetical protein
MMDSVEGAWILAFIAMIGTVCAGLLKLIAKNGCRLRCNYPNGNTCCDTDCDEGRQPINRRSPPQKSNTPNKRDSVLEIEQV